MVKSIANPALASEIADTIRNKAEEVIAKKKKVAQTVVYEHMQHQYDKEEKIIRQSCMKAAASAYNSPVGEKPEVTASNVIKISKLLMKWVNSK